MSSFEIDILVLFNKDKNFDLSSETLFSLKSSAKFGKLSDGKQSKLKSEILVFRLSLFSLFNSKLTSEPAGIFLKISYKIVADDVVLPSVIVFTSRISS